MLCYPQVASESIYSSSSGICSSIRIFGDSPVECSDELLRKSRGLLLGWSSALVGKHGALLLDQIPLPDKCVVNKGCLTALLEATIVMCQQRGLLGLKWLSVEWLTGSDG